jgi:hypothetical protein
MSPPSASEGRSPERCVVAGHEGSDSAGRAVARSVRAAGASGKVVIVTVEPKMPSHGIVAEPLVESGEQASRLLAEAREIAEPPCSTDVLSVARRQTRERGRRNPGRCASHTRGPHRPRTYRQELPRPRDSRFGGPAGGEGRTLRRARRRLTQRPEETRARLHLSMSAHYRRALAPPIGMTMYGPRALVRPRPSRTRPWSSPTRRSRFLLGSTARRDGPVMGAYGWAEPAPRGGPTPGGT